MGEYLFRPDDSPPHKCDVPLDERRMKIPSFSGTASKGSTSIKEVPALGSVWRCECGKIWEVRMYSPNMHREQRRTWLPARWRTKRKYSVG